MLEWRFGPNDSDDIATEVAVEVPAEPAAPRADACPSARPWPTNSAGLTSRGLTESLGGQGFRVDDADDFPATLDAALHAGGPTAEPSGGMVSELATSCRN
jgi:hypothetical protein